MATITEDYVSFETAKLLKEKGFDEVCRSYFIANGGDIRYCGAPLKSKDMLGDQYLRPTLQLACKWLREVHNIHIVPIHIENRTYRAKINGLSIFELDNPSVYLYEKYEYVIEFAIKYALEKFI